MRRYALRRQGIGSESAGPRGPCWRHGGNVKPLFVAPASLGDCPRALATGRSSSALQPVGQGGFQLRLWPAIDNEYRD